MDASQYKDYILTILFVKYISDKSKRDSDYLLEVPEGGSFSDMVELKGDAEIGDKINKIITKIAEANDLLNVINNADFADDSLLGKGKKMVDRLTKLISIFEGLDFESNRVGGDDLLGDAYEYLMRNFATESGKSKGQFYTPAEVSRILAKTVGIGPHVKPDQTVYDPTCGSGSLLLKAAAEAPNGISIYGQESENSTWALAKMNMVIHNQPTSEMWCDDTLSDPYFKNDDGGIKTFDFAVVNPPFSSKAWSSGFDPDNDEFARFEYGTPPPKNGDYAFLLHVIKSLKSKGKGAIILPHGVLFRGNKEADIRKRLVDKGLIKGIIGLPANLFYGTGIPACIIIIDKEKAHTRENIFFIDASKGFVKDGNKNRLRERDVHKIVETFNNQIEEDKFSRLVNISEIKNSANDYNLNIPRYIDSSEPEDIHDLNAHLLGGIPNLDIGALDNYWKEFSSLQNKLFKPLREGYSESKLEPNEVTQAINADDEVTDYRNSISKKSKGWEDKQRNYLTELSSEDNPKEVIVNISEDLMKRFEGDALMDKYAAYQQIREYWDEELQDDVHMIIGEGWDVCKEYRLTEDKETPEFQIGKKKYVGQVIPAQLIINEFYSEEQKELNRLESEQEQAKLAKEEFEEEQGGEEGSLSGLEGDNGKVSKGNVQSRVLKLKLNIMDKYDEKSKEHIQVKAVTKGGFGTKEWQKGIEDEDGLFSELDSHYDYLVIVNKVAAATKVKNEAEKVLMKKVSEKYPELEESEIKMLVLERKWYASIRTRIDEEVQRIIQELVRRVKMISERYASTLSELEKEVEENTSKVEEHLKTMGLSWK